LRRQFDGFFARINKGKPKATLNCLIDLLIVAAECRPNPAPQKRRAATTLRGNCAEAGNRTQERYVRKKIEG